MSKICDPNISVVRRPGESDMLEARLAEHGVNRRNRRRFVRDLESAVAEYEIQSHEPVANPLYVNINTERLSHQWRRTNHASDRVDSIYLAAATVAVFSFGVGIDAFEHRNAPLFAASAALFAGGLAVARHFEMQHNSQP